ncbi:HlyD family secretion protein [Pseudomonas wadenswilerensis]|uniref:HlyD family secretion protein n=1 Tax=Pseudomonas wadenswilerensis TaxID=1785161 RepID=UPI00215F85EA|nr:HlyD family secretion protein [Pseudomonas wadenswilerensis]UVM19784.1 HlyD family secretion protein [Pseudomonas wadenswilerensis]
MNQAVSPDPQIVSVKLTRRRQAIHVLGAAGLLAVLAYGGYWWSSARFFEQTDDAYVRADWAPVSARVAGYVTEVRVADNARVKAGDVLVRLDDRDYRQRLRQARAQQAVSAAAVQAQQAHLVTFGAQLDEQRQAIARAQAERAASEGEARRAQLDWQRYRQLAGQQAASAQRLESATASRVKAQALLRGAAAELERQQARQQVLSSQRQQAQADLASRQAALEQAEAELGLAENALADTEIRAPFDGVVGQRKVRQQQYVTPGLPLLAVVPVAQAYVVANYKETQLEHLRPGQRVTLEVDTFGRHWQGTVDSVSPGSGAVFALLPPDNATGNFTRIVQRFPVRIQLDAPPAGEAQLLPGMSVIATVDTREARHGS